MQGSEHTDIERNEPELLNYLVVMLKRKKMIAGITLAAALATAAISLLMTPVYRAETRILPPQSSSGIYTQILSEVGGGAAGFLGSALSLKNPNEIYVGMLKSRTIYDRIIDRFGLIELYEAEYREDAREDLDNSVRVKSGKDEIISVSVEDEDPGRAADMANAFVEELREITQKLAVAEASKRRLFFEEQLKGIKEDLIRAEKAMQSFQEKTGAIKIEEQAEAVIESIAKLRAELAAKEVDLKVMKTYARPGNPDLQKAEEQLKGMREELAKFERKSGDSPDPLMPTGRMPEVGADYFRNLRDLKYYENLFEIMAKQYEIARVDEAKDAAIIQVLDRALPPDKRAKPKRTLMMAMAVFAGLSLAVFAAFFMEYVERVSADEENRAAIEMLRRYASFRRTRA